jgi:hypothetical protein
MEIGIDSFAAILPEPTSGKTPEPVDRSVTSRASTSRPSAGASHTSHIGFNGMGFSQKRRHDVPWLFVFHPRSDLLMATRDHRS